MTSAQVVETSGTNNSSFQNYPYLEDRTIRTTDIPGFKPITMFTIYFVYLLVVAVHCRGDAATNNTTRKPFPRFPFLSYLNMVLR